MAVHVRVVSDLVETNPKRQNCLMTRLILHTFILSTYRDGVFRGVAGWYNASLAPAKVFEIEDVRSVMHRSFVSPAP